MIIVDFFMQVFGIIREEQPKYEVVKQHDAYEIRRYAPCVAAATDYSTVKENGPFMRLAGYIGVLSEPKNIKAEKIAMTAPVIMSEKEEGKPEAIAMTAPVLMANDGQGLKTMRFVLPGTKYPTVESAPVPKDPLVRIELVPARTVAVLKYSWNLRTQQEKKSKELWELIKNDNYAPCIESAGQAEVAGYNPPFTLPFLRTNEVMIPIKDVSEPSEQQ
eukprot:m.70874 g.70874  ORF g.70874 m.70874 type:complete len:218 (-) comp12179_c0_seq1:56-709(-)